MPKTLEDQLDLQANVEILVHDAASGRLLKRIRRKNLVVLNGRNIVRDALAGTPGTYSLGWLAVGTGTTTQTSSDTALQTEVYRAAMTLVTPSSGAVNFQLYLGTTAANGKTLSEAGLFNASVSGTMGARTTFTGIAKDATKTITFSWTITIGAS